MQLINVAFGGTLMQHMAEVVDQRPHREDESTYGVHPITVVPGTKVSAMCETATVVYSHHHQSVGKLAPGLIASAYAPDETIEAIELDSNDFCVGVLWHPDAAHDTTGASLFSALVKAACEMAVCDEARNTA
jgi:putative glutamine amidotransferase